MSIGKFFIEKNKITKEIIEYVEDINTNKKLIVVGKHIGINGDKVKYKELEKDKCEILNIECRIREYYFGILNVTSKTFYGVNDNNKPIYQFRSSNNLDPIFMVTGKQEDKKNNMMDIYCLIKFEKWNIGEKNPIGSIVERYGEVGSEDGEYYNILMRTEINMKAPTNKKQREEYVLRWKEMLEKNDDFRQDFRNNNVFSIDPPNCQDIDDAIDISDIGNNRWRIGVHIADVGYYLDKNNPIDEYAKYRSFSIYTPRKRVDMLPYELATNICSLVPNEERKTFSAIFEIDKIDYEIKDVHFCKGVICSKYKFDYELAQKIIDNSERHILEDDLRKLSEVCNNLEGRYLKKNLVFNEEEDVLTDKDSHRIIEVFAILTNHYVSKYLEEKCPTLSIQRIHKKDEYDGINIEGLNLPKSVIDFMNLIRMKRAYYGKIENVDGVTHWGLNLRHYTHFTSPIRRYNDILIHRILWKIINGDENNYKEIEIDEICERMNEVQDKLNRMEREYYRMECLIKLQGEINRELNGWIIGLEEDRILVYFPEIKLLENIYLYDDKNKHLLNIIYNEKKLILENCIFKKENLEFKLLDKVMVKMTVIMQSKNMNDKLKIKLIEPNLYEFINNKI
jgi:exoribonuclease R